MKRVRVGDIEVAYAEAGAGERPFVLVHGYSGCRQDFDPVLPALAELGRNVVPDLRGHGHTSHASEASSYTFARLVGDLLGFLDALAIERCDLLGHSMGGMLALRFALSHPERLASLVLMDTTPRAPESVDREDFARAWAIARAAGMHTLQRVLQTHLSNAPNRAAADRRCEAEWGDRYWMHHRRRFHRMDPEAYARLGLAMLDQEPVTHRLREIACPTLVLVGEQDEGFLAASELLAREIPGAEYVVVPDAEHHPQRENPQAWLDAVTAHLARVRGLSPDRGSGARASRGSP